MYNYSLIKAIEAECNTPFYIVFEQRFENNIKQFSKAFNDIYDNFHLSYSFKTNYTPPLLNMVKDLGCFAETVSQMEYEMALRLGFRPDNIIFNGPIKKYEDLEKAIRYGSIIHLDGEYETELIEEIRKNNPDLPIKVGLRVNMEINTDKGGSAIQAGLKESRFGHTVESLGHVIPRLKAAHVVINSLHGHTSSTNRVAENYRIISQTLLNVRNQFGLDDIEYFDLGGGFFGAAPAEVSTINKPSYVDYAEAICSTLLADEWFADHKPAIVIEPGTSVTCNVFELVTKVYQHKIIRDKHFIIVDASRSLVRSAISKANYLFDIVSDKETQPTITADIVGSTCMEVDVVGDSVKLDHYQFGDYLVFKGEGAYRHNMNPFFINARPAIVKLEGETFSIVRSRQTSEEMLTLLGYII